MTAITLLVSQPDGEELASILEGQQSSEEEEGVCEVGIVQLRTREVQSAPIR